MKQPLADNPAGFWEHAGLAGVNDEILTRFGGCWHEPPVFAPGWEQSHELTDLRMRTAALLRDNFSECALWGWKDPRACLTLPFWRSLLPPMRYVLCVRSPLAVAHSLRERDRFSFKKSGSLWLTHVVSALAHTSGDPRLIMAYEDLLTEPDREVRRLARFIGRRQVAEVSSAVEQSLRPDLQHHRPSLAETLTERELPFPARALYAQVHLAISRHRDPSGQMDRNDEILTLVARVAAESSESEWQDQRLLDDYHRLAVERDRLHDYVQRLQSDLARYEQALGRMQGHPVWRAYHRLRFGLLPDGSRREVAYLRAREWLKARRHLDR
jgi:hypothetical protein